MSTSNPGEYVPLHFTGRSELMASYAWDVPMDAPRLLPAEGR